MDTVSTKVIKEIDRITIEEYGIPARTLTENAGIKLTKGVYDLVSIKKLENPRILVICGTGNNGADGLVCARQLHDSDTIMQVLIIGTEEKLSKTARYKLDELRNMYGVRTRPQISYYEGGELPECDMIVDALLGVGINREVSGVHADIINKINAAGVPIVSCDIPSGLNGDTGEVMGTAVKADATVTMTVAKDGMATEAGAPYCGAITVGRIGTPEEILTRDFTYLS